MTLLQLSSLFCLQELYKELLAGCFDALSSDFSDLLATSTMTHTNNTTSTELRGSSRGFGAVSELHLQRYFTALCTVTKVLLLQSTGAAATSEMMTPPTALASPRTTVAEDSFSSLSSASALSSPEVDRAVVAYFSSPAVLSRYNARAAGGPGSGGRAGDREGKLPQFLRNAHALYSYRGSEHSAAPAAGMDASSQYLSPTNHLQQQEQQQQQQQQPTAHQYQNDGAVCDRYRDSSVDRFKGFELLLDVISTVHRAAAGTQHQSLYTDSSSNSISSGSGLVLKALDDDCNYLPKV
jgi:hypothetical protein